MNTFQAVQSLRNRDQVYIRNLRHDIIVGKDAWGRANKAQPLLINLWIFTEKAIENTARDDDITKSIDYSQLCKTLKQEVNDADSLVSVAGEISFACFRHRSPNSVAEGGDSLKLELTLPKGVLQCNKGITYTMESHFILNGTGSRFSDESTKIEAIQCACVLGVNPHERLEKQPVSIDLSFGMPSHDNQQDHPSRDILVCYRDVVRTIIQRVEGSAYHTVESLATVIARVVIMEFNIFEVTVNVDKPFAISDIEAPGVQICRTREFFEKPTIWEQSS